MVEPGHLYVISAPSGTGKTTLVKALVESTPGITVSISHTTRSKRPNELHGINYYFISQAEFDSHVNNHDFLEYATVFGNSYGTSRRQVEQTLAQGCDVILEIDWQGAEQVKNLFSESTSIFILPPSAADLYQRLIKRNQDHPAIIKQRITDVKLSTAHIGHYDYIVLNDDFSLALHDLKTIVYAGRLAQKRQCVRFAKLINDLTTADVDKLQVSS